MKKTTYIIRRFNTAYGRKDQPVYFVKLLRGIDPQDWTSWEDSARRYVRKSAAEAMAARLGDCEVVEYGKRSKPMNIATAKSPRNPERVEVHFDGCNTVSLRIEADKTGTYGGYVYMTQAQAYALADALKQK